MRVTINGEERVLGNGSTVAELLQELRVSGPVAVEINRSIVVRKDHAARSIADGDRIEIVELVGGG